MTNEDRNGIIKIGRDLGVSDAILGTMFNVSRQWIHKIAGPQPEVPPRAKPDPPRFDAQGTEPDLPVLLRSWRQRHGWNQIQAAAELGVTVSALNRWENGRASCKLARLVARFIDFYENTPTADR